MNTIDDVDSSSSFGASSVLGGLLSAYELTGHDQLYLDRAIQLADRILPAFDTESGLPTPNINLAKREGVPDSELPFLVSTAEVSTLQLEFRYLSYLTDEETYWEKVEAVSSCFNLRKV